MHVVRQRSIAFMNALKKSGYANEIPLESAKTVFSQVSGFCDRTTIKAYFGTQPGTSKRILSDCFQATLLVTDMDAQEDPCEIINKIRDVMAANPNDVNKICFLQYLAKYPLSMCKRDVSPLLKQLIGFHY